jgi:D-xylose 1-dehydrogenase (NADP+, D-xylono-1,5-lactone-forming)
MNVNSPLRVAMVGCGGVSRTHAQVIVAHPQRMTLVACADIDQTKADEWAAKYNAQRTYTDYRRMLEVERPDITILATWPVQHEEQVLDTLARGCKAILCEKSMAMTGPSARRMADAARKAGAILLEGFSWRHLPRTLTTHELVGGGKIGTLRKIRAGFQRPALVNNSATWKENPAVGGGVLYDFTCYAVNAIGAFTTGLPARVHATCRKRADGLFIDLHGLLEYPDGFVGIVESSYGISFNQPLEIHGDSGLLRMNTTWVGTGAEGIEFVPNVIPMVIENIPTPQGNRTELQLLHLCDCVQQNTQPRFSVEESVRNHVIIDALVEAAEKGTSVTPRAL